MRDDSFILKLDDPLWCKLDIASASFDIPERIKELSHDWDEEEVEEFFYSELINCDSISTPTYAAVPHLIAMGTPEENRNQRAEIAVFLGYLARCVFEFAGNDENSKPVLDGLPLDLKSWEEERDRRLEYQNDNNPEEVKRYHKIRSLSPPNSEEWKKIQAIREEFFMLLPDISDLCQKALFEKESDIKETERHHLAGIAAANRLGKLASMIEYSGEEGAFECSSCQTDFEFLIFSQRLAFYQSPVKKDGTVSFEDDLPLLDWIAKAPLRADGFIGAICDDQQPSDSRLKKLLFIVEETKDENLITFLKLLLGSFDCPACGKTKQNIYK